MPLRCAQARRTRAHCKGAPAATPCAQPGRARPVGSQALVSCAHGGTSWGARKHTERRAVSPAGTVNPVQRYSPVP